MDAQVPKPHIALAEKVLFEALRILADSEAPMPRKTVVAKLEAEVNFTEWEREPVPGPLPLAPSI